MQTGIFCNYENYRQDAIRAFQEQIQLVKHAEGLGFDEAWVTEHHFNNFSVSSSILVLLAHLAGVTSKIRLGSAAVLLAFHNPINIAEDIATIDNLCNGRFAFGIAKGGPFPEQNKHFGTPMDKTRAKMLEAMQLIGKLLSEENVSFSGEYYQCENLTIFPKPVQKPIPTYLATGDLDGIEFAAANSFGLMGGAPFNLSKLKNTVTKYRSINSSGSDKMILVRFFFVAKTYDDALSEALPYIRQFKARMKGYCDKIKLIGASCTQELKLFYEKQIGFEEEELIDNSIIGDPLMCRNKIKKLQDVLNLSTLALKPASFNFQKNLESLTRYNQEVRNYV